MGCSLSGGNHQPVWKEPKALSPKVNNAAASVMWSRLRTGLSLVTISPAQFADIHDSGHTRRRGWKANIEDPIFEFCRRSGMCSNVRRWAFKLMSNMGLTLLVQVSADSVVGVVSIIFLLLILGQNRGFSLSYFSHSHYKRRSSSLAASRPRDVM